MQDFAARQRGVGAGFRGEAEGGRYRISRRGRGGRRDSYSSHKGRTVDDHICRSCFVQFIFAGHEFIFAGRLCIFADLVSFQMQVPFRFR